MLTNVKFFEKSEKFFINVSLSFDWEIIFVTTKYVLSFLSKLLAYKRTLPKI